MNGVPAPLVGFARLGLVLVVGVALWKPAEPLAPVALEPTQAQPAAVVVNADVLAQSDTGNSLLVDFVDAVGLDEAL